LALPQPWASSVALSCDIIDDLDRRIASVDLELRRAACDDSRLALLRTIPGVGPVLAATIAAELGDVTRFPSARQLVGYTGLAPFVMQSGERDRRGPLTKHGPRYLRWALIEAATHACRHAAYRRRYLRTRRRLGRQRGPRVARVEVARQLATAIWHMLTKGEPFAPPAGPTIYLVA
ncbi:MAG: transposase, partial [Thermoleophilaceae bacterium]